MSHGYGSLKGIIGVWLVAVSAWLLMGSAPMVSADTPAAGSEVVIAATIEPVRIVVVDDRDRITTIFSNGPGDISPSIHRGNSEGQEVAATPSISSQYSDVMRRVDQRRTGLIYKRQVATKPHRLTSPTAVSVLLSGLRPAL